MAAVGEGQMQNLVMMFLQGLHLHAGNTVKEPLELPVPRNSRCKKILIVRACVVAAKMAREAGRRGISFPKMAP